LVLPALVCPVEPRNVLIADDQDTRLPGDIRLYSRASLMREIRGIPPRDLKAAGENDVLTLEWTVTIPLAPKLSLRIGCGPAALLNPFGRVEARFRYCPKQDQPGRPRILNCVMMLEADAMMLG
jgi:hypothetical protein